MPSVSDFNEGEARALLLEYYDFSHLHIGILLLFNPIQIIYLIQRSINPVIHILIFMSGAITVHSMEYKRRLLVAVTKKVGGFDYN